MIRPPHRSVTRFFIPMIDVLILLFCIFLLMPYVAVEGDGGEAAAKAEPPPEPTGDVATLTRQLDQVREDRDRLLRERGRVAERLAIRVLEIDRDTGKLYDYDPERLEIATEADALALVNRERRKAGAKELFVLILFPREVSGFPLQKQVVAYEKWFRDVPHGFDSPFGRP